MSPALTRTIKGTDCIGDSRFTINLNFSALDISTQQLSSNLKLLSSDFLVSSSSVIDLESDLISLSSNTQTLSTSLKNLLTQFNTNNIGPSATLTTYVSSLSVYTSLGNYIGFIPIYLR